MKSAFFQGLRASLSIAVGYVPVAISFGLAAVYADISPFMAILISLLVYAGASQFILVSLVAGGGTAASVIGIVWLMNLRHFFYGPALISRLDPGGRRLPLAVLAAGLTDEVFAASISKLEQQPAHKREYWYAGLQLGAYAAWVGGTALGAYFGHDWIRESEILAQALGFVLPALFFALLLEVRKLVVPHVLAGAALATALSLLWLPAYAALIAGMLAGVWLAGRRA
ncbi:MAG: AzlC family ABC transporter permease [Pusillimonas sp.]